MPAELSIFIDESGDFGSQSEAYLLTFVLRDQSNDISSQFARLSQTLKTWAIHRITHCTPAL